MDQFEFGSSCQTRDDPHQGLGDASCGNALLDCFQARRPFGMPTPGIMTSKALVRDKGHSHAREARPAPARFGLLLLEPIQVVRSGEVGRTAGIEVIRWCGEEARAGPWRGRPDIAYLSPRAGGPTPSLGFVQCCLDHLAADGFTQVVTSALTPLDQEAFFGAGFEVHEHLRVLAHDLGHLRPATEPAGYSLRRARGEDTAAVLRIDSLAFEPFWQLDHAGLGEAISATPHARFRVATSTLGYDGIEPVVGYAITGRAISGGFLQRLAVEPAHEGAGLGGALVLDGLHWLRRWRVNTAFVNTQAGNNRAFGLYQRLGFRADSGALSVLSAMIGRHQQTIAR